jgi:dihydroorotase
MTSRLPEKVPGFLLIKNGTVIDPLSGTSAVCDILLENGLISKKELNISAPASTEVIDASALYVTHGFFDMHVHLREPGGEAAETFATGAESAMAGGVTSLLAMANTTPCVDNLELFLEIKEKTKYLPATIHQLPAVTMNREGKVLTDMGSLAKAGAAGFTDDGGGIASSQIMKDALKLSKKLGKLISVHAEDHSFAHGVMNESELSDELGLPGLPYATETINIARDIELARYLDCRVHFQHISSKHSVELIRKAKSEGIKVSCEACPHHFSLTEEKVRTLSTNFKMNPPLRKKEDVEAIIQGLKDGTVDVIATDHAPHTKEKKDLGFLKAPFGVTGLETLFSAGITYLVRPGKLSLNDFIAKITCAPRKLLGFEADLFKPGTKAELVIFDPNLKWLVDGSKMKSKSINTCYQGELHYGKVLYTISKGRIYMA